MPSEPDDILVVKDLRVNFHTYAGDVKALDGVEFSVKRGEVLGLVGESGSGKSVTALSIEGLLPANAEVISGEVLLEGKNLLGLKGEQMREARLTGIAMVFQDPTTYLNPVITVGSQMTEIMESGPKFFTRELVVSRIQELKNLSAKASLSPELRTELEALQALPENAKLPKKEFKRLAKYYSIGILRQVRLPEPERIFKNYPFELSGGMKQRAMIAMALARRPKLFLADEITTALDVTVQAQILKLLQILKDEIDTAVILITHDLAVVAEVCDRVAVMYAGNIVELADVDELFKNPLHPYTQGLLASIPRPDTTKTELTSIKGSVPNLIFPPTGCRFHPRCPKAFDRCIQQKPPLVEHSPGHFVECFLYGG